MGTKNSDLVANFEAAPQVANSAALLHGVVRVAQGTIALAAGDSDDNDSAGTNDDVAAMGIQINTYIGDSLENTFYLTDFLANAKQELNTQDFQRVAQQQNMNFIQNVSPSFINNTANTI